MRYGLSSAEGVAEVASIGGFVKEYQVDVDPDAMKANNITLEEVMKADFEDLYQDTLMIQKKRKMMRMKQ